MIILSIICQTTSSAALGLPQTHHWVFHCTNFCQILPHFTLSLAPTPPSLWKALMGVSATLRTTLVTLTKFPRQKCWSVLTVASRMEESAAPPSEAGPHCRLCRPAAGLAVPTLIYCQALPSHPPFLTHINPSYSICPPPRSVTYFNWSKHFLTCTLPTAAVPQHCSKDQTNLRQVKMLKF